jgi:hypothetical protein
MTVDALVADLGVFEEEDEEDFDEDDFEDEDDE